MQFSVPQLQMLNAPFLDDKIQVKSNYYSSMLLHLPTQLYLRPITTPCLRPRGLRNSSKVPFCINFIFSKKKNVAHLRLQPIPKKKAPLAFLFVWGRSAGTKLKDASSSKMSQLKACLWRRGLHGAGSKSGAAHTHATEIFSVAWVWAAPDFYTSGELHTNAFYTNSGHSFQSKI